MKVIQIAGGGDRGGAKTHIISLCSHLKEKCELSLVSLRSGEFAESAKKAGIDTHVIFSSSTFRDYFKLIKFIKAEKPDIVHCHGAKANLAGTLIKLFCGCTIVTTVHSDYKLDYMHSFIKRNTIGKLNAFALRTFDYYVPVSDLFKEMLISRGFKANNIMPIYNGLDFSIKTAPLDKEAYIRSAGLAYDEKDVILGILARLNPVKDIPTLLRAFAKAKIVHPNLKLLIGGDGEDMAMLKKLSTDLGISDSVAFMGWIDNVPEFFSVCDIDVLCSISESFPYSVLEGIRGGCCVITSEVGGMSKLIDNGINGYIFKPGDVDTFAEYIIELSHNAEKRHCFARSLYKKASSLYSIESMANTQFNIYQNIINLTNSNSRYGVLICGAYGRGNSGDEAILKAIVDSVKSADPLVPITVMTKKPLETSIRHGINTIYTFKLFNFLRAMKKCSIFINGGGNLIQDSTSSRSLYFYLYTIFAAKRRGCRVLMYGCGIGKVHKPFNRKITKRIINKYADIITLRDNLSKLDLDAMGITIPDIRLTSDPAMSIIPAPVSDANLYLSSNNIPSDGKYICFSLRQWGDFDKFDEFAKAAEYAYAKYGLIPIFLPIETPRDTEATNTVISHLTCPYHILKAPTDASLLISVFGKMQIVCAIRLHALVFAAASGSPFIAASYDIKVNGFMSYIQKDHLCCDLSNISSKWLCECIEKIMAGDNLSPAERLRYLEKGNVSALKELLAR